MNTENIQKKIDSLMLELQKDIGVSDEELNELKEILALADFSDNN